MGLWAVSLSMILSFYSFVGLSMRILERAGKLKKEFWRHPLYCEQIWPCPLSRKRKESSICAHIRSLDNCTYKSRLLKNVLRHGGSTPKCLVRVTNTAWYQPHHSGSHALDHSCIMSTRSGGTSQGQHCFPTKYVGKSCATLSRWAVYH